MKRQLPPSINKNIGLMRKHLNSLYGTTEPSPDQLLHYQLSSVIWGPSDFRRRALPAMYFIQEHWKRAREVYFYERVTLSFYDEFAKQHFPGMWLLPFVDEEARQKHCRQNPWPPEIIRNLPSQNEIATRFLLRYAFDQNKEQMHEGLKQYAIFWRGYYTDELLKTKHNTEKRMLQLFYAFSDLIIIKLFNDKIDEVHNDLAEYDKALEWRRQNPGKKLEAQWGDGPPWETAPFFSLWLNARNKSLIDREAAAEAAAKHSDQAVLYLLKQEMLHSFPLHTILLMVMRIDLEVERENCREFARYFMPFLTAFPFLKEKVAALDVEYIPPDDLPSAWETGLKYLEMKNKYAENPKLPPPA